MTARQGPTAGHNPDPLRVVSELSAQITRLPCVPTLEWFDAASACLLVLPGAERAGAGLLEAPDGTARVCVRAAGGATRRSRPESTYRMRCEMTRLLGLAGLEGRELPGVWASRLDEPPDKDHALWAAFRLGGSGGPMVAFMAQGRGVDAAGPLLEASLPLFQRAAARALGEGPGSPGWVSPREHEVLRELILGRSVREIAESLGRSPHTVHDYVKNLHKKLHAGSRGELVARALGFARESGERA